MEEGTENRTIDDTSRDWQLVAEKVEAFIDAWDSERPPTLTAYAIEKPIALRKQCLIELIKIDLENRFSRDDKLIRIEKYLDRFPELLAGGVPCDLLYEEFHIRKQSGESVDPEEYIERFPDASHELAKLFGIASANTVSSDVPKAEAEKSSSLEPGSRFDDFDLLLKLGAGAFANVFLARQLSMNRLVALKVSADRGNEPQTLAQLEHPHIVRVYDVRSVSEQQLRLLYMQYVSGGTLQGVIKYLRSIPIERRTGRLYLESVDDALHRAGDSPPIESSLRKRLSRMNWPEAVCWIGARLAEALEYAHRRGVLHRDVKPANVLVSSEGAPKLADFNISFSSQIEGSTPASYFGGSLAYMSPEQLEACDPLKARQPDSLDGRSDVYSLAVMIWELLFGERPFDDSNLRGVWGTKLKQMTENRLAGVDHQSLPIDRPLVTPGKELVEVLTECLAPDPDDRPRSAGEMSRELELCLHPHARKLLREPAVGWRRFVRRFPGTCLFIATLLPNMFGTAFNIAYNHEEIIMKLGDAESSFVWSTALVNSIAYPAGIFIIFWFAWPLAMASRPGSEIANLPPERSEFLRKRALSMGTVVATVCIVEWAIAGLAFPFSLQMAMASLTEAQLLEMYLHFFASLLLCGLIAAAYPFIFSTYLGTSALYPAFARTIEDEADDRKLWKRTKKLTHRYFLMAVSVPFLSVALLAVIESGSRLALLVLGIGGAIGAWVAHWLAENIRDDIDSLETVLGPGEGHVQG